jgi:hypothetical protein
MVLIVMFLFFTVYMNMLSRNKDYQDAVSRSNQLDINKVNEQKSANATLIKQNIGGTWFLRCTVSNSGVTPVRVVRIWVMNHDFEGDVDPLPSNPIIIAPSQSNVVVTLGSLAQIRTPNPNYSYNYVVNLVTSQGNILTAFVSARP